MTTIERKLTTNALTVLEKRYLRKNKEGEVIETPTQMFRRVADAVGKTPDSRNRYYDVMSRLQFLPNSPTLMNAGTNAGTLAACFVIPVDDKMIESEKDIKEYAQRVFDAIALVDPDDFRPDGDYEFKKIGPGVLQNAFMAGMYNSSMMGAVTAVAAVQKYGGGTGFNASMIRPMGELIASTHGFACGPVSFLEHWADASRLVTQGGKRDGANMGILDVDHSDIMNFITFKDGGKRAAEFNISVNMSRKFINAHQINANFYPNPAYPYFTLTSEQLEEVRGPKYRALYDHVEEFDRGTMMGSSTYHKVPFLPAKYIMDQIVTSAHRTGDPGLVFMENVNDKNPHAHQGMMIVSTNPCGEVPLLPWEPCNLGSIVLPAFAPEIKVWCEAIGLDERSNEGLDYKSLEQFDYLIPEFIEIIRTGTRFLDNVVDANTFPVPQIAEINWQNRKTGLGVMGLADLNIDLGIPYDSHRSLNLSDMLAYTISRISRDESEKLAAIDGPYPSWTPSDINPRPIRNATRTCIAPTGTIAIIGGSSSGIEPLFSVAHLRRMGDGTLLPEVNERLVEMLNAAGYGNLVERVQPQNYDFRHDTEIPEYLRDLFVQANDVNFRWHVRHQQRWQRWTDLGVSKTVNLAQSATVDDVRDVYLMAADGCNGITIYRDGSRAVQVLDAGASRQVMAPVMDRKLPDEHPSVTKRFKLGEVTGYFTIGLYEDGSPAEVFCIISKGGSSLRGLADDVCIEISHALQRGEDLERIVRWHENNKYDPAGATGDSNIPFASSIFDYLAKFLRYRFLQPVAMVVAEVIHNEHVLPQPSGETCPDCGGLLDIQEKCNVCRDCGYSKCG